MSRWNVKLFSKPERDLFTSRWGGNLVLKTILTYVSLLTTVDLLNDIYFGYISDQFTIKFVSE